MYLSTNRDDRFLLALRRSRWGASGRAGRTGRRWASWAEVLRGHWTRRAGRFQPAWALLAPSHVPVDRVPARVLDPSRPALAAATARIELGPFLFLNMSLPRRDHSAGRPARLPDGAVGSRPAEGPRPLALRPIVPGAARQVSPAPIVMIRTIRENLPRMPVGPTPEDSARPAADLEGVRPRRRDWPAAPPAMRTRSEARVDRAITRSVNLTRRLIEERVRRETAAMAAPGPPPRVTPMALVVAPRRTARAAPEVAPEPPRAKPDRARATTAAAAPVVDVERLTDQVVRRIDDRIVAFRERMGRAF